MMACITHCFSDGFVQPLPKALTADSTFTRYAFEQWPAHAEDYARKHRQPTQQVVSQLCSKWCLPHSHSELAITAEADAEAGIDSEAATSPSYSCPWAPYLYQNDSSEIKHLLWYLHQPLPILAPLAIQSVAFAGNVNLVKLLLQDLHIENAGLDPKQALSPEGHNALHLACKRGHVGVAEALLAHEKHPIDVNVRCKNGWTPLSYAAFNGHLAMVKMLLAVPHIDPNPQDPTGNTPLLRASRAGRTDVVAALLADPRINVDLRDKNGWNPLICAAMDGHAEVASVLLADKRLDPNTRCDNGDPALIHATMDGHANVVQVLLQDPRTEVDARMTGTFFDWASSDPVENDTPASHPSRRRRLKVAAKRLAMNLQIKIENSFIPKFTALGLAAMEGHVDVIRVLLADKRADPNAPQFWITPLMVTAFAGKLEAAEALLEDPRVDVNAKDPLFGVTALYSAALWGGPHLGIIKALLAHGADPNIRPWDPTVDSALVCLAKHVEDPPQEWREDPAMGRRSMDECLEVIEMLLAQPGIDLKGFKPPKPHPLL